MCVKSNKIKLGYIYIVLEGSMGRILRELQSVLVVLNWNYLCIRYLFLYNSKIKKNIIYFFKSIVVKYSLYECVSISYDFIKIFCYSYVVI